MDIQEFVGSVSATEPDWSREKIRKEWDPGRKLIRAIRRYQAVERTDLWGRVIRRFWSLNHLFWSTVTQCEIHLTCEIEGGLLLPHPNGIIIHPKSKIGPNCLIMHQVTLAGHVRLGGHVDIGTGAKLLGPRSDRHSEWLTVGDHVQIGANAVVSNDLPPHCIAAGIPARVIRQTENARFT